MSSEENEFDDDDDETVALANEIVDKALAPYRKLLEDPELEVVRHLLREQTLASPSFRALVSKERSGTVEKHQSSKSTDAARTGSGTGKR